MQVKGYPKWQGIILFTELEMCRLSVNSASFVHLLKRVDFNATVNHLALTEPALTSIKRLLVILSFYSFNLYYIKGRDMVPSNFLSRQKHDHINPHEIKPISFNMQIILQSQYYNIGKEKAVKYLVQTRS